MPLMSRKSGTAYALNGVLLGWVSLATANAAPASYSARYTNLGSGYDVTALVIMDPATGSMSVTLSNLVANTPDAVHAISGAQINFTSNLTATVSQTNVLGTGQEIAINTSTGTYTTGGTSVSTTAAGHWGIAGSGSVLTLATVAPGSPGGQPTDLIVGNADANNKYSATNSSLDFNTRGDMVKQSAVFNFNLTAQSLAMAVASINFIFGTAGGPQYEVFTPAQDVTTPTPVVTTPEPASLALFASAVAGLGVLRRRLGARRPASG